MPRLMSFSLTADALLDGTKTVTRRLGWRSLRAGDELRAVRKVMGRSKGEPIEDLARIRVLNVRREPLNRISAADVAAEGYPNLSPSAFVAMFCEAMGCAPDDEVTRIEFEVVASEEGR